MSLIKESQTAEAISAAALFFVLFYLVHSFICFTSFLKHLNFFPPPAQIFDSISRVSLKNMTTFWKDFTGSQHDPNLQSYIYGCWVDINENEAKGFFTNKILFHLDLCLMT